MHGAGERSSAYLPASPSRMARALVVCSRGPEKRGGGAGADTKELADVARRESLGGKSIGLPGECGEVGGSMC
jgi:hypothetical protein